jgi:hypothetical protein
MAQKMGAFLQFIGAFLWLFYIPGITGISYFILANEDLKGHQIWGATLRIVVESPQPRAGRVGERARSWNG